MESVRHSIRDLANMLGTIIGFLGVVALIGLASGLSLALMFAPVIILYRLVLG